MAATSSRAIPAEAAGESGPRRRDAANTRQLLLDAARRRFAHQGYAATTVREIADDVAVNVALISRYFDSKEGLFEACLAAAVEELSREAGGVTGLAEIPATIAARVAGSNAQGKPNQVTLMLLLRSSGDERTEALRFGVLRRFSERLASIGGWQPDTPGSDDLLLRAQLVLAVTLGITVLRSSSGLAPLASATEAELAGPLQDLVTALLANR